MHRWLAVLFVVFVLGAAALVMSKHAPAGASGVTALSASADASSAAPATPAPTPIIALSAEPPPAPTPILTPPAPPDLNAGSLGKIDPGENENEQAGATLPDGTPVPALAATAPKQVSFGVVLVQYAGAQGATRGARSRDDALKLASEITTAARENFAQAAIRGDVYIENAGSIQRDVLERLPEYVLFSLAVGDVSEPVDSPKGFYIFKRLQ
ncbi:MAG: hypothetical protein U0271_31305 [Polyangiaceae bacterium]